MLWHSFFITGNAVIQISLLAALGYVLVRKDFLGDQCLVTLSNIALDVCLPALILYQLLTRFSYQAYPEWWTLPLLSFAITAAGIAVGSVCSLGVKGAEERMQCISLVGFQNSGWLPLALIGSLAPEGKAEVLFIYLFLFLAGFNFAMFSLGTYMLTRSKRMKLEFGNFFNPPVTATVVGVALALAGVSSRIPGVVMKPMHMLGECTLPLAMLVVGGCLAQIHIARIHVRPVLAAVLGKMVVLPALGLMLILALRLPEAMALTILLQVAAPSAMSLSAILKKYGQPDLSVSHGILLSHLVGILTLPLFLSIYFTLSVVK